MAQRNDIEDVLSSIRRLVASEVRPAVNAAATASSQALVLEQAQRVTDPDDPFQTIAELREPEPEPAQAIAQAAPHPVEDEAPAPVVLDRTKQAASERPESEDEDDAPDPNGDDFVDLSDLSEAIQSDDALRDLIAEIVRQELAGALGERITRNVRKLVRRELRQIMSGEEFD
ncbi:hypothetical protein [Jannaschia seohaensis]|uniref:Uncharacterized protein n=1 Tax=Jannaschia seohaensis TaxID=475081 RepID=A0A2Y9AJ63_9RHOB|nr:hypothetical protein [Jannaschia seohaensis]PWJ20442.1 hypothetical protein BCF38_103260 [Jannaschia seohaensis]SSA44531.1 hypothetical protein SAMN05421539_103260 [Jannaschia seohaensis]